MVAPPYLSYDSRDCTLLSKVGIPRILSSDRYEMSYPNRIVGIMLCSPVQKLCEHLQCLLDVKLSCPQKSQEIELVVPWIASQLISNYDSLELLECLFLLLA